MHGDYDFIMKLVGSFDDVIQMHVTELVDLFSTMLRPEKGEFCNQDLSFKDRRVVVESRRRGVARVTDERCSYFVSDVLARHSQVANFVAAERLVLQLQLLPSLPDKVTDGGNRVLSFKNRDDVIAR